MVIKTWRIHCYDIKQKKSYFKSKNKIISMYLNQSSYCSLYSLENEDLVNIINN